MRLFEAILILLAIFFVLSVLIAIGIPHGRSGPRAFVGGAGPRIERDEVDFLPGCLPAGGRDAFGEIFYRPLSCGVLLVLW
jgi:hypothetical protein